ncbi:CGI-121-domain-containing protein [Lophium mytilinum]|uniref:EKC/KEOPS complex subunit CGI121 n=1 Tax=Lophium mytilinum TaxID=390894 RepID=A0A6A6QPH4_9PEZI|nr:CGI-121-domain-containing protein [Lophium mytilinum]
MATVETLYLPHYPSYPIYISLFKNVSNAKFLRQQLLEANAAFEYAFLDGTMILSPRHLHAATFRALNDSVYNRLKSRNIHSELVFSLSPNNNIADAYRRFGIQDSTTSLLAIKIPLSNPEITAESVSKHLGDAVEGESVAFGEEALKGVTDVKALRKGVILGMMALKGT